MRLSKGRDVVWNGEGKEEHCALIHPDCLFEMPVSTVLRESQNVKVSASRMCLMWDEVFFFELYQPEIIERNTKTACDRTQYLAPYDIL